MGQGEVIDGKICSVNKEVAKRDHGRRFSAVVRAYENCRLLGEVHPYGLKLSKVADLDMLNMHGVSLYVPTRQALVSEVAVNKILQQSVGCNEILRHDACSRVISPVQPAIGCHAQLALSICTRPRAGQRYCNQGQLCSAVIRGEQSYFRFGSIAGALE